MVRVLIGGRPQEVEVVLGSDVLAEHVAHTRLHDEPVLRALLQAQPRERDDPAGVGDGGVYLLALGVDDRHAVADRGRVEVAIERHIHGVRLDVHTDHLGALAEVVARTCARSIDDEKLAVRIADKGQRFLVVADVELVVRQHQPHHEQRRIGVRDVVEDLPRCPAKRPMVALHGRVEVANGQ